MTRGDPRVRLEERNGAYLSNIKNFGEEKRRLLSCAIW